MPGSILVPLDGSELAERVLAYATALSIPSAAPVLLVRAVRTHSLPGTDEPAAQARALAEAETYLADVAASLRARGFECEWRTVYRNPAESIVSEAQLHHVRLIAMTTHGRTGPGRWLLGSVAEGVVSQSPVPVLVERAWHPIRREPLLTDAPRLLVPLDGSPFSESAVEPAARLADDIGAELTLLRVDAQPTHVVTDELGKVLAYVDELEQQARSAATDYLVAIAERVGQGWPGLTVTTDVRFGEPAETIARVATISTRRSSSWQPMGAPAYSARSWAALRAGCSKRALRH
jgi:nucleotide-binding universal stress UspA family protein